jgi:fatty-acid peroxygenase
VLGGYEFVSRRCARYGSDVFETRLLAEPTVCMRGAAAARVFYDAARFRRAGAVPARVQKTLLGVGGVQGLDGEAHRRRKALFMSLMSPSAVTRLGDFVAELWRDRLEEWERADRIVLYDEVGPVLCHAVHLWAGVPITPGQVPGRTNDLRAMIEAPAAVGPPHRRGRSARRRAEHGLGTLVKRVRAGTSAAPEGSAAQVVSAYRDPEGQLLDGRVAAVELLNLLRPTVAVDRFITFAALALHAHPQWRRRLRGGDGREAELFVQEVRRFYPFFPMQAARVRTTFDWQGVHFPVGRRVLLDLYGTDHHPQLWEDPDRFDPDRFRSGHRGSYDFIPQGGGNHHAGHRCPGEWITIELMKRAVTILTGEMDYDVPDQDLRVSLRRMPTLPTSRFLIANVRRTT